jgi:hypothetical protein
MSREPVYAGPCVNGPLHGQRLIHKRRVYDVALLDDPPVLLRSFDEPPDGTVKVSTGRYFFHDGAWKWLGIVG